MPAATPYLQENGPVQGQRSALACFGKHPAWADHMDDLGLETHTLAFFKQWCYVDGIGQCLGRGRWPEAASGELPWRHWLIGQRAGNWLIARLIASSDSRGRKQYPFVMAAHVLQAPGPTAVERVCQIVERAAEHLAQVTDAASVKVNQEQYKAEISDVLTNTPGNWQRPAQQREQALAGFRRQLGPEGLPRLYHALVAARAGIRAGGHWQARVPWDTGAIEGEKLAFWFDFLYQLLGADVPLTQYWQDGDSGATVISGSSEADAWTALFPGSNPAPFVQDIPYTIPPEELQAMDKALTSWQEDGALFQKRAEANGGFMQKLKGIFSS